jgi:DNA/RNA endonuclease YhcR with UshA esterase domain
MSESMNQFGVICHAPMFISELNKNSDSGNEHVSLCGIVVDVNAPAVGHSSRPLVVRLDDGTGCIDCAYFKQDKDQPEIVPKIGASVLVNGVLNSYR